VNCGRGAINETLLGDFNKSVFDVVLAETVKINLTSGLMD
jgi:hypothetical protein